MTGSIALNQLVGPPLGAFLFAAGMALPFVTQAVASALGRGAGPADRHARGRCP